MSISDISYDQWIADKQAKYDKMAAWLDMYNLTYRRDVIKIVVPLDPNMLVDELCDIWNQAYELGFHGDNCEIDLLDMAIKLY